MDCCHPIKITNLQSGSFLLRKKEIQLNMKRRFFRMSDSYIYINLLRLKKKIKDVPHGSKRIGLFLSLIK